MPPAPPRRPSPPTPPKAPAAPRVPKPEEAPEPIGLLAGVPDGKRRRGYTGGPGKFLTPNGPLPEAPLQRPVTRPTGLTPGLG